MKKAVSTTARSWTIIIVSMLVAVALAQTGWLRMMEDETRAVIAQLGPKQASGQLHLVEVDAASLAQAGKWPWPRDHYARLVDQLDEAGVRSIVFDIDFSSHASPDGDAAFASAITEAEASVVLPTFAQRASETAQDRVEALPVPSLRENTSLASVSVRPDADARVRRIVYGTVTDDTPRPSLSAQIAGVSGAVGEDFAIDFSIDPRSIPRHSFANIEAGDFDASQLAGRDVMVGATAIELGDRYGVPTYGVIPGVTVQALAAETLMAGAMAEFGYFPLLALAALLSLFVIRSHVYLQVAMRVALALTVLFTVEALAYHSARTMFEAVPGAILILFTGFLQSAWIVRQTLLEESLVDTQTGLPNALAFNRTEHKGAEFTVTAFIKEFDSIRAVLGQERLGKLIDRLVDRMSSVHSLAQAYRADTRMIAWVHQGDYQQLIDAFEKIDLALEKSLEVGGRRVDVQMAFGIASGADLDAASRAASHAASEGKLWHAHEDAEAAIIEQRVSLMGELDEAIGAEQLKVVYQPKLRLETDRIESVEALLRWEHPTRGHMRPDLFIPLAEETNRIDRLTLFVLKRTISDLLEWCKDDVVVSAAVNISANLITSDRFVAAAEHILQEMRVPRDRLVFEVTESAAMTDPESAARNLERFRELGVLISIDDYGTGQSTLSYLQQLPLSELKIDRAFVQNAHVNRSDGLMVRSTIDLAHSLDLRVVCEGVEEQACLDFLRENGCDYAQGYLIAKPLPPKELASMLEAQGQVVAHG
ncbi:EAL domain-containing protein [uncultured Erythrobacter sp.]|uniref:GGDEF domain-containing phosphodiesterase n=1 Tax=uncultured Erythrobacter sp. TaxID=263913 RepID=UPI002620A26F|nr:EAL domain-containing protein [uncultured Erythrobacter sp.]